MSGVYPFDLQLRKVDVNKQLEKFLTEAEQIHKELKKNNVKALVYGSVGIFYHVKNNNLAVELMKLYRRGGVQDINMIVKKENRDEFKRVIYELGYTPYFHLENALGDIAGMFFKEEYVVKVYYSDFMEFNHIIPIDWNADFVMNKTDLVLSKLQIHNALDKDLADFLALLLVDFDDSKIIELTSSDWGLWKDVTDNLNKARQLISRLITDEIKEREEMMPLTSKVVKLHGKIMNSTKKETWKPLPEGSKYWRDF